jgi:hypothetical protein
MHKRILLVGLSAILMSTSAMASAKYLYFVIHDGKVQKVHNLNMDPLYSAILGKTALLSCNYKSQNGQVQSFEFMSSECGGGPILTLNLESKTSDGKQFSSSASALYVEHRSVMMSAAIGGENEMGSIDFSVMSATQYQDLLNGGDFGGEFQLPSMDQVPLVSRQNGLSREKLPVGLLNCSYTGHQDLCARPR